MSRLAPTKAGIRAVTEFFEGAAGAASAVSAALLSGLLGSAVGVPKYPTQPIKIKRAAITTVTLAMVVSARFKNRKECCWYGPLRTAKLPLF